MPKIPLPLIVLAVAIPALAACDLAGKAAPPLRFATAQMSPDPAPLVLDGHTVRFTPATYDSILSEQAARPPFPVTRTDTGVRIDGYYVALNGNPEPEASVSFDGDVVVLDVYQPRADFVSNIVVPYVYSAHFELPNEPVQIKVVHTSDDLTDTGGRPATVFNRLIPASAVAPE